MKIFSEKKHKKGFTTAEVLLTVAILMIVMGLVIPGIIGIYKNLKLAKLDDTAREIYTSAQSRTVSLSVNGKLTQVSNTSTPVDGSSESRYAHKYPEDDSDAIKNIDKILPPGSVDETVRQNYYIIEYDSDTGMVNGVYYWEDKDNGFKDKYEPGTPLEDKTERMKYMVGYYGGNSDVKRNKASSGVEAELVNGEELYLKIKQGRDGAKVLKGTITVTLKDLDTGKSLKFLSFKNEKMGSDVGKDPEKLSYDVSSGCYKLILDSLDPDLRFSKLVPEKDGSFNPGCNLKVTVSFKEDGKRAQEESFLTNSLFASVKGKYDPSAPSRTAYISCGRHLENLGLLWVYCGGTVPSSAPLNGVQTAVQTADIDWHQSLAAISTDDDTGDNLKNSSFKPIVNENLKEFDGGGNKISHIDIFGDVKNEVLKGDKDSGNYGIGLFSRFAGTLQNINLVNCTVRNLTFTESKPLYVGLLAGTINGTNVSGCHAYATKEEIGGIDVFPCFIDVSNSTGSTNITAGGLFGFVQGTEMTKCSASLTKIAGNASYVGGLAGCVNSGAAPGGSVAISQCYADTGMWSAEGNGWLMSGQNVGGLVGRVEGSNAFTMENSYAVGWVSESNGVNANGLVGNGSTNNTSTIENCYAALMKGIDIVEGLVPGSLASAIKTNTCISYNGSYEDFNTGLEKLDKSYYVLNEDSTKRAQSTHAYGMPETDDKKPAYPFPRLSGMPHHGDWPQGEVLMAYYEVYQKPAGAAGKEYSIGFYTDEFNTLKDDENYTVVNDGYAVLFPVEVEKRDLSSVKYNTEVFKDLKVEEILKDANGKLGNIINANLENTVKSYYPLFLSDNMMEEDNGSDKKDSYYQKLEVQEKEKTVINVYFNPYVAKSKVEPASDATSDYPSAPKVSIFRTARQVSAYSFEAMKKTASTNHTLRLERNITGPDSINTNKGFLNITASNANVILDLNGKTLEGKESDSVVYAKPDNGNGILRVYGNKENNQNGSGTIRTSSGMSKGICMENGAEATLTNVTIEVKQGSGESVDIGVSGGVTLDECTITIIN